MIKFKPDLKPLPKEKKKVKSIKKISAKRQALRNDLHTQDKAFYEEIWSERCHTCTMCNASLYEPLMTYFHHILEKGKRIFKHLRHEKDNVIIVCQDCHDVFHSANKPDRFNKFIHHTFCLFQQKGLLS